MGDRCGDSLSARAETSGGGGRKRWELPPANRDPLLGLRVRKGYPLWVLSGRPSSRFPRFNPQEFSITAFSCNFFASALCSSLAVAIASCSLPFFQSITTI